MEELGAAARGEGRREIVAARGRRRNNSVVRGKGFSKKSSRGT